jgi:hypothetical protein
LTHAVSVEAYFARGLRLQPVFALYFANATDIQDGHSVFVMNTWMFVLFWLIAQCCAVLAGVEIAGRLLMKRKAEYKEGPEAREIFK